MGSSGAGKDSLLKLCLDRLQDQPVLVAHRYITRLPEQEGENHIWLPAAEFRKRRALDLFALCWSANGLDYGIGCEIDLWLARGHHVLVNGSRAFLAQDRKSTRLNSSHVRISYAVFCLKKKKEKHTRTI